jgi:hypothetical protein
MVLFLPGVLLAAESIKQGNHIYKLSSADKFSKSIDATHYGDSQRKIKGSKYHFLVRRGYDDFYYVYERIGD